MKMSEKVLLTIYLSPENASLLNGQESELASFYRCPTIVVPLSDKKKTLSTALANFSVKDSKLEKQLLDSCGYSQVVKPSSLFTLYLGEGGDSFEGVTCTTLEKINLLDIYPLNTSIQTFEDAGYTVEELILYYFITRREFEFLWYAVAGLVFLKNAREDDLTVVFA